MRMQKTNAVKIHKTSEMKTPKMFRRLPGVITAAMIMISAVLLLTACIGPQYKPEEEAALRDTGVKMMQEWLDANLPGNEVTDADAYLDIFLGGPHELTDYVEGTYTDGDESYGFFINTVNGEVFTTKGTDVLQDLAWDYLLETLELDPAAVLRRGAEDGALTEFDAQLYIDSKTPGSGVKNLHDYYLMEVLPADVVYGGEEDALAERIDSFLHDPARKYPISLTADLLVPDEVEVSRYTPGALMTEPAYKNAYFEWLRIHDTDEDMWHYGWMGHYTRYGWIDLGDFRIRAELDYLSDKRSSDAKTGYDREETHVDPAEFCPITATEEGYRISYPEEWTHYPEFYIVAKPDSKIMKYDYLHTSDEGKTTRDCHWRQRKDGDWELVNYDWLILNFGYNTELRRRGDWDPAHPETQPK